MVRILKYLSSLLLLFQLVGCYADPKVEGANQISQLERNQTAATILNQNKGADILCVYESRFYTRAEKQEQYNQNNLLIDHELGEIKKKYIEGSDFENEMSTNLPVGTKIYTIQGERQSELLIVKEGPKNVVYIYRAM
ncbi:hypothetical protein A8709_25045 [Paenibacillus pectinilyticus]|uniref:Lipoprotein n=1 Tax=Paenibacillus pectinilyticus TaxID=512399 RepID=A0A1C1A2A1_9BACL|nr:hypothetical protein [Paenibacillus pectinilyticus]OCT14652.1 hypothetical protein A8709_25045 [Paenibacillus pectinilyticus]